MIASRIRRVGLGLAVAATLVLFLCSLLVLVSAPNAWLWMAAIVIGEWCHFGVIAGLLLALLTFRAGRLGAINAAVALLAAALCLTPLVRAALIGRALPQLCSSAFDHQDAQTPLTSRQDPFSVTDLFRGVPTAGVDVSEHVYAKVRTKRFHLDLYRAADAVGVQPLIIVVHGGSWRAGSRRQLPALNRYLARQNYTVAAIDYRHAPRWPFPAAVEDVYRAIDFLRTNSAGLQIDGSRIVLIGRSAGGQIALSAAYAARDPAIRGVVSLYGPTDLVLGYERPSRRAVIDSQSVLEDYLGGSPAQNAETYRAASPVNHVTAAAPPTLLIQGSLDPIVWPVHSELLAKRLEEAGTQHLHLRLPWATHGLDANLSGPSGQLSLYAIECLLSAVMTPPR